jgi:hypothetical protein
LIYLASPYSHPDQVVREERFRRVCKAAARLIDKGEAVFCPIAHSHPIEVHGNLQGGWDYWSKQDIPFLEMCDEIVVLGFPGWDESEGVKAELEWWGKNKLTAPRFLHADS